MIAWCRICRPGSVVGPQQQFCADYEHKLIRDGEAFKRKAKSQAESGLRANVTPEKAGAARQTTSPEKDAMAR